MRQLKAISHYSLHRHSNKCVFNKGLLSAEPTTSRLQISMLYHPI